ncbi:hypothetical protein QVD17_06353 [Tagetes erecta]|uniref:F-box/LRR-repeat protein 15/At3g58940/PEG3-like LRR domain-containing protein n=1 Tax=Tagetes erecta TaxID=13708 RepID=A0AAD8LDK8_TARER|nr:hypothetical protein QVD17_06353 [Tagetes erecta]
METLATTEIEEDVDRISHLPDFIIHNILSRIGLWDWIRGGKEHHSQLLRLSVLSKKWFNLTASFPYLIFRIDHFHNVSRLNFFKYVEYATSRFCHHHNHVTAHTFKLSTTLREPAELDIVIKCVELVLNKGVRVLSIDILSVLGVQRYRLPNILSTVSMLESLAINGCYLPSSFMVNALQFKSLIRLKLQYISIDDEVIKYLNTSCPLLQDLEIRRCNGFKIVCVTGHQNLQNVTIAHNTQVERIHIEAPNLSELWLDERRTMQMNLVSCKKLRKVTYFGDLLPNSNSGFLSNFPFVDTLMLDTKCNNLKLSSHSLRTLVLLSNYDLEDIEFRTPNLASMYSRKYLFTMQPSVVSDSTHLKASMHCNPYGYIDATWFQKLRQFLDKKNGLEVLNLHIRTTCSLEKRDLEKLKAIELPPYELEHVQLQLDTQEESSAHRNFVDAVFWCCRPRSLILKSSSPLIDFEEQSDIVKFTHEKLLEQEDQSRTKIQIVPSSSCEAQIHLSDLKSLSKALPSAEQIIKFIKEEA